jgi:cell division cycle protein 20 (cofactor of APC complex)
MYSRYSYDFFQSKNTKKTKPNKTLRMSDRYIPHRAEDSATAELQTAKLSGDFKSPSKLSLTEYKYANALSSAIWDITYDEMYEKRLAGLFLPPAHKLKPTVKPAIFTPILDDYITVPGLANDFYFNPLACVDKTKICIGLDNTMFIYDIQTRKAQHLKGESAITALAYGSETYVIAGLDGKIHYLDSEILGEISLTHRTEAYTKIVFDGSHGFYAASNKGHSLTHIDLRTAQRPQAVYTFEKNIAGFTFSQQNDVGTLAISNGTTVEIFDPSYLNRPRLIYREHIAPSKGLAFSPNKKYIATGGGRDDRTLRVWSLQTGKTISQATTDSQICNVYWVNEQTLVTTTGFKEVEKGYKSGVSCWTLNGRQLIKGGGNRVPHTNRVLYADQNPADPKKIVTADTEQNLRFWSINKKSAARKEEIPVVPVVPEVPEVPDSFLAGNRIR